MTKHSRTGVFVVSDRITSPSDFDPCDAATAQYALSNLVHGYDCHPQTRVNSVATGQWAANDPNASDYKAAAQLGPWVPTVRADGSTPEYVVRVAAKVTSGTMSVYARITNSLASQLRHSQVGFNVERLVPNADNVATVDVSGTSHAWYTLGPQLSATSTQRAAATLALPTYRDKDTSHLVQIEVPLIRIDFFVKGGTGGQLSGAYAREFIG